MPELHVWEEVDVGSEGAAMATGGVVVGAALSLTDVGAKCSELLTRIQPYQVSTIRAF